VETHPEHGLARARELPETGNLAAVRNVAHALGWGRGRRTSLINGEADLLRSLLRRDDLIVRQLTVAAGRTLSQAYPALAAELVTTVRFADSPLVADAVAGAFSGLGYPRWNDLSASQASDLLSQLTGCPSISEYHITQLLDEISSQDPEAGVDLRREHLANSRMQQRQPRRIHEIEDSLAGEHVRERHPAAREFLAVHEPETRRGVERRECLPRFSWPGGSDGRYVPTVPEHSGDLQNLALAGCEP